jgi:hypothetical protein
MKGTTTMGFENNESVAAELVIFADNNHDLYRQKMEPIFKNLIAKMASGQYDSEKAVKQFMYLAESAAKLYAKDARTTTPWHVMFPVPVRKLAATHWRDSFEGEAKLGNYDNLLPKKYQKQKISVSDAQHMANLEGVMSPAAMRSHSVAYQSGMQAAIKYAQAISPSKLQQVIGNFSEYPAQDFDLVDAQGDKNRTKLAKILGITTKDILHNGPAYGNMLDEYDRGYLQGLRNIMSAIEGN